MRLMYYVVLTITITLAPFYARAEGTSASNKNHSAPQPSHQTSVLVFNKNGWSNGIIVSNQGHILTVSHGLGKSTKHKIKTANGDVLSAHTIYRSQHQDLALLKIKPKKSLKDDKKWPFTPITGKYLSSENNQQQYEINALSFEKKSIQKVKESTSAMFSDINLYTFNPSWTDKHHHNSPPVIADGIIIDIPVEKGFSGSGLFNANGELVGMIIGTINVAGQTKTIAIEPHDVQAILDLEKKGIFESQEKELEWMLESLVEMGKKLNKDPEILESIKETILREFGEATKAPLSKHQALNAWKSFIEALEKS